MSFLILKASDTSFKSTWWLKKILTDKKNPEEKKIYLILAYIMGYYIYLMTEQY